MKRLSVDFPNFSANQRTENCTCNYLACGYLDNLRYTYRSISPLPVYVNLFLCKVKINNRLVSNVWLFILIISCHAREPTSSCHVIICMKTYYHTVSTVGLQAQDASYDCYSISRDPLNTRTPVRCFKG